MNGASFWISPKRSIDRGVQSYPLCNARLFNNRLTMKNAQVFDDLPTWKTILFLPLEARIAAIKDPETRKKMRYEAVEEKKSSRFSRRWDLVYLINAVKPENKYLEKKSVAEIAKIRGQDVIDAFLDLSLEEGLDTEFQTSSTNGDEEAVAEIIRSPYVLVGQSDAGAHLIYDAGFGYATRLLGYWVREKQIMTLEEAVRKLTFMVASIFGLPDRGLLRRGMAADLCVFDPATIRECDAADGARPAGQRKTLHSKSGGHRDDHRQRSSAGGKGQSHRRATGRRARGRQRPLAASGGVE